MTHPFRALSPLSKKFFSKKNLPYQIIIVLLQLDFKKERLWQQNYIL